MGNLTDRYEHVLINSYRIAEAAKKHYEEAMRCFTRAVNKYLLELPLDCKIQFAADNLLLSLLIGMCVHNETSSIGWENSMDFGFSFVAGDLQDYWNELFDDKTKEQWQQEIKFVSHSLLALFRHISTPDLLMIGSDIRLAGNVPVDFIIRELEDIETYNYFLNGLYWKFYEALDKVLREHIGEIMERCFSGKTMGAVRICDFFCYDFSRFYESRQNLPWDGGVVDPNLVSDFLKQKLETFGARQ